MTRYNPDCLGQYNFENIARFARKKYIEGCNTIDLLVAAQSQREREEVALVASLDLDDETVTSLSLSCRFAEACQVTNCRKVIKEMIEDDMKKTAKA